MAMTVIALFKNPAVVEEVVKEIEKLGIPKQEVETVKEAVSFPINGVMRFTRLDYEVDLRSVGRDRCQRVGTSGICPGTYPPPITMRCSDSRSSSSASIFVSGAESTRPGIFGIAA
jgi:hypothetical protein